MSNSSILTLSDDAHRTWGCIFKDEIQVKWSTLLPMLLSALLVHSGPACAAEVLTGPARIVDGDTLEVGAVCRRKSSYKQHSKYRIKRGVIAMQVRLI